MTFKCKNFKQLQSRLSLCAVGLLEMSSQVWVKKSAPLSLGSLQETDLCSASVKYQLTLLIYRCAIWPKSRKTIRNRRQTSHVTERVK